MSVLPSNMRYNGTDPGSQIYLEEKLKIFKSRGHGGQDTEVSHP
jgi:hypothetical protein